MADRLGRRPTCAIALAVAVAGALGAGWGMAVGSFPLFMVGVFAFGLGIGAGLQLRVVATDMFPHGRWAEGLGTRPTSGRRRSVGQVSNLSEQDEILLHRS